MKKKFNKIDRNILEVLQVEGRMTMVDLAERVNLTKTPCAERVRRLERDGVIKGYRAELDPELLGAGFMIIVQVALGQTNDDSMELFNDAVSRIPEIQICFLMAGNFDYLLLVRTSDIHHYRKVLADQIGKLPGVRQTQSYVVLEEVSNKKTLPVS